MTNRALIACAGSGKTTRLVEAALGDARRRIAIVTYTNNNLREVVKRFGEKNSCVPSHVEVATWYAFLLRECARPYQRARYVKRIESLAFVNQQSARGVPETNTGAHYFAGGDLIYSDKIAKFVVRCEEMSAGAVSSRLAQIYTDVFIDEFQDLAGWDLEVVEMLLRSRVRVTLVGDPRQHIYSTNPSSKNSQFIGVDVVKLVERWRDQGLCSIEHMTTSHRCSADICDFSNALWPGMPAMTSARQRAEEHDGVFVVSRELLPQYVARFRPQALRHDRRAKSHGLDAMNFGVAKGLQFERVLIIPTAAITKYLTHPSRS